MNQIKMSQFQVLLLAKKIKANYLYQFCLFDIKLFDDIKMFKDKIRVQKTYKNLIDKGYINEKNAIVSNNINFLKNITDKHYIEIISTIPAEQKTFVVKNASFSKEGAVIAKLDKKTQIITFDLFDINYVNDAWYEMLIIPQNYSPSNKKLTTAIKFKDFEKLTYYFDNKNEKLINKLCKKYAQNCSDIKNFLKNISESSNSIAYTINYLKLFAGPSLLVAHEHEKEYYIELHDYYKKKVKLIYDDYGCIIKTIVNGK